MLGFKSAFSLSSFTPIKRLFSSYLLSANLGFCERSHIHRFQELKQGYLGERSLFYQPRNNRKRSGKHLSVFILNNEEVSQSAPLIQSNITLNLFNEICFE